MYFWGWGEKRFESGKAQDLKTERAYRGEISQSHLHLLKDVFGWKKKKSKLLSPYNLHLQERKFKPNITNYILLAIRILGFQWSEPQPCTMVERTTRHRSAQTGLNSPTSSLMDSDLVFPKYLFLVILHSSFHLPSSQFSFFYLQEDIFSWQPNILLVKHVWL